MNFMIFSAQYLPTVGGVERYTNSLAKKLIEKGHSVTVVTSALKDLPMAETDENDIKIIRLPVIPLMNGRFPVLKPSIEKKNFEKFFSENKPDFCVIQTRFYTNSIMAAILCKKYNVPNIVIEHGTAHLIQGGIVGFFGNIYEHVIFKYVVGKCPDVYGVSLACCKWLEHFGKKTENVLYNSVNPEDLQIVADTGERLINEKFGDSLQGKTVIFFSARFVSEKGVRQLISAFENLNKKYPDTVLAMAGGGPLWQEVRDENAKNIILTGQISYEENMALMRKSDIFCLPTFSEGFATTVLEAAALKTVIVTTATGGSPQLLPDDSYGIIIPDMEADSIQAGIEKAMSSRAWRISATENTYKNLCDNFTWEKTSERLIAVAQEKLKGKI